MKTARPITIIGGGLAGLTLGIGLRKRSVPVTIREAGNYPRHRVCGEFINGQGVESLRRLGLLEVLERAGVRMAQTTAFHNHTATSGLKKLPTAAICISRWSLDAALASEFGRLGGDLHEGDRWHASNGRHPEAEKPTTVNAPPHLGGGESLEFRVHATGRRAQSSENGWRWFGVKAHARNVSLQADLEMFLSRDCYVGVSWLPGDEVNVCGLFRRRPGDSSPAPTPGDWFASVPHPKLQERLASARYDENSFCSVAGLTLRPQRSSASGECRIGDAITMIPPLTGNGMSMAFESAEIAVAPITASSRGEISWRQAQQQIAYDCDRRFSRRLRCARWLQSLAFRPAGQSVTLWSVAHSDWLWRAWFSLTR